MAETVMAETVMAKKWCWLKTAMAENYND